jgi:hypothetical protein
MHYSYSKIKCDLELTAFEGVRIFFRIFGQAVNMPMLNFREKAHRVVGLIPVNRAGFFSAYHKRLLIPGLRLQFYPSRKT